MLRAWAMLRALSFSRMRRIMRLDGSAADPQMDPDLFGRKTLRAQAQN
jgi:hypothetical protein